MNNYSLFIQYFGPTELNWIELNKQWIIIQCLFTILDRLNWIELNKHWKIIQCLFNYSIGMNHSFRMNRSFIRRVFCPFSSGDFAFLARASEKTRVFWSRRTRLTRCNKLWNFQWILHPPFAPDKKRLRVLGSLRTLNELEASFLNGGSLRASVAPQRAMRRGRPAHSSWDSRCAADRVQTALATTYKAITNWTIL